MRVRGYCSTSWLRLLRWAIGLDEQEVLSGILEGIAIVVVVFVAIDEGGDQ